jgi:hypothetical protein
MGKCGGKRVDVRPNWKERPDVLTELNVSGGRNGRARPIS